MGNNNTPYCCEKDENIDNIIQERNETFNFSPEGNKIADDASFISNQGGEYPKVYNFLIFWLVFYLYCLIINI